MTSPRDVSPLLVKSLQVSHAGEDQENTEELVVESIEHFEEDEKE